MRLIAVVAIALLLSGCVNLMAVRNPISDVTVTQTYLSTKISTDIALVVAFPQVVSLDRRRGLSWWNALTVPLGCVVLVDTACEAVVDTVLYPVDAAIVRKRRRGLYDENEEEETSEVEPVELPHRR